MADVTWRSATELLDAADAPALLVTIDSVDAHRVYFEAGDAEQLAKLCAVPVRLALDSGVWPLACKIVRDNPEEAERRHLPFPPLAMPQLPVSRAARVAIDALITAVAAGARSTDGSHVQAMAAARYAVVQHIARLERLAR